MRWRLEGMSEKAKEGNRVVMGNCVPYARTMVEIG